MIAWTLLALAALDLLAGWPRTRRWLAARLVPRRLAAGTRATHAGAVVLLAVAALVAAGLAALAVWWAPTRGAGPAPVAWAGVLVLFGRPANDIVRAALTLARLPVGDEAPLGTAEKGSGLRGGRWIGPLERILLVLLGIAGQGGLAAAVVAAKGVIRFPEISRAQGGEAAEEFLVGSMLSWLLAALAAILLAACW